MATSIKQVVEHPDTRAGRRFDLVIQGLIIAALVSFSVETLPGLSARTVETLQLVETILVAVFTLEYLLRLAVADSKLGFVFSFFGLIDLAAILPFYLATGLDLRSVRAVRLLRLFRILKLFRYSAAIQRYHRALLIAREELVLFFMAALIIVYLSAAGIYHFEHPVQPEAFASIFHSMWWAVATLTSVGYGDIFPITVGGKIFTVVMLMAGLGIVAVPTGLFASALSEARKLESESSRENTR